MKKEDLINCKVRVPTEEISRKVQEKLFELGFRWFSGGTTYKNIENESIYMWEDYELTVGTGKHFKEIPYTDIIGEESEDFSSWQELYQWCANKRELCVNINGENLFKSFNYPYQGFPLARPLTSYKKSLPKPKPKEVVLYNYLVKGSAGIYESGWQTFEFDMNQGETLLKTETKTVILEG